MGHFQSILMILYIYKYKFIIIYKNLIYIMYEETILGMNANNEQKNVYTAKILGGSNLVMTPPFQFKVGS